MGNCAVTIKKRHVGVGAGVEVIADVNLSSSYTAGGDTLPLAALGVDTLQALLTCGGATSPGGHAVEVVEGAAETDAPKLKVRDVATGAEVTGNQSAQSIRVVAKANYPYV